ncbi:phage/plasmid primase, P4 family [Kolteria novifilia]
MDLATELPIDRVLSRLEGVRQTGEHQWEARCPAHEDRTASLSVGVGDRGQVLVHCHTGCSMPLITKAIGLHPRDLCAPTKPRKEIAATYNYVDESGKLLFQAVRMKPKDFRQRVPDGSGGWRWKLNGARRVLYRLPELLAAAPSEIVFVVEGEKDANRLTSLGLVSTCNAGGAGKWRREYAESLEGRHVVIIPDNDDPGRDHAGKVAASLSGVAATVKALELPDLPPKGDVSDWLDAGHSVNELRALVADADEWEPSERKEKSSRVAFEANANPIDKLCAVENLSDVGNGRRLVHRFGDSIRYCHPWSKWLIWTGSHWSVDDSGTIRHLAHQAAKAVLSEAMAVKDEELRKDLAGWAIKSEVTSRLDHMIKESAAIPGVPIGPERLNAEPWLLPCPNGTVNLRTGDLRPHRREDYLTAVCPTNYDENAECPRWEEFLGEIFAGSEDLIDFIWKSFGIWLTGTTTEQALWFLWGTGSNGKSVFTETVMHVLGDDYAAPAPDGLLTVKNTDDHPTLRAMLFAKRFVAAVETEEGRRLNETAVKLLTGGDKIACRRMREDWWDFTPTHKLVMVGNHKPRVRGQDHAIWRRIRLIPFTVTIPDERQDKQLPQKLRDEAPGILAWAVRGCLAWQKDGLGLPDVVKTATAQYRAAEDVIGQFIEDECVTGNPSFRVRFSDLYKRYKDWCDEAGERQVSSKKLGQILIERGFEQGTTAYRSYVGIALENKGEIGNG